LTDDRGLGGGCPPGSAEAGSDIRRRAFQFACRIVRLARFLEHGGRMGRNLADQLFRSGTSVGANLEEARGAQSRNDFRSKCSIALKEARETLYWLRVLQASGLVPSSRLTSFIVEAEEPVAILTSIVKKTRTPPKP
jgi:four helix bundle protein